MTQSLDIAYKPTVEAMDNINVIFETSGVFMNKIESTKYKTSNETALQMFFVSAENFLLHNVGTTKYNM